MRVTCVLGPYFPVPAVLGGAVERVWLNLATEFARKGHEVTLVSRRFSDLPVEELRDGIRFLRVPSRSAPRSRLLYRFFDAVYAARVAAMLPPADITVTNSVSLPVFLSPRRVGQIYVSVARFPKGQIGLYRQAARLQAVSQAVAKAIVRQTPAAAGRVRVLPNALSATFSGLASRGSEERRPEILYVGRIAREKGLDLLIRAFMLLSTSTDWFLTIVGPADAIAGGDGDEYRMELETAAAKLPGRIRFESAIFDEHALAARMQQAAIFAYPSVAESGESFGMAPLEAMACGCAVVVSALDCFNEFAHDGFNCLVFDHRDPSGRPLADALETLMLAAHKRQQLSAEAFLTSRKFSAERVADLFLADFDELMSKQPSCAQSG